MDGHNEELHIAVFISRNLFNALKKKHLMTKSFSLACYKLDKRIPEKMYYKSDSLHAPDLCYKFLRIMKKHLLLLYILLYHISRCC
jgi:hypothetical protein